MEIPEIVRALDAQIAQLQQARQLLSDTASRSAPSAEPAKRRGRPPGTAKPVEAKPAGKRIMSDEGKARIAAAQKKRWAKSKRAAKAAASAIVANKTAAPAKDAPAKKAAVPASKTKPAKVAAKKAAPPTKKAVAKKSPAKKSAKKETPVRKDPHAAEAAVPAENTAPETSVTEVSAEA